MQDIWMIIGEDKWYPWKQQVKFRTCFKDRQPDFSKKSMTWKSNNKKAMCGPSLDLDLSKYSKEHFWDTLVHINVDGYEWNLKF